MSKKENNFGKAMYDMFGVGKDVSSAPESQEPQERAQDPAGEQPQVNAAAEQNILPVYGGVQTAPVVEDFRVERAVPVHTFQGTYLAAGTDMEGTLSAKGDVEVAGDFRGEINAKGKVTLHSDISSKITAAGLVLVGCSLTGDAEIAGDVSLDSQSAVLGNIQAENMVCSGRVKGDLVIAENLVLEEYAEIDGNIKVSTMTMAKGAKITGNIEMGGSKR